MSDTTNIFEEMPDVDTVGGRISRASERLRPERQGTLAWRLGVKMATVNAWERDRSEPSCASADQSGRPARTSAFHGFSTASASVLPKATWLARQAKDDDGAARPVEACCTSKRGLLIEKLKGDFDRLSRSAR